MIYVFAVGVALERPPKIDEYRKVVVVADSAIDARIAACQISACTSVMPVDVELLAAWREDVC